MIYPTALFLIGADIDNRANFMALAWGSTVNSKPAMFSVAINYRQYTLKGIRQNMAFSINIPSVHMAQKADYCGLVSGANINKTDTCNFKVFYGKVANAPLIEECPINVACRVEHIIELPDHALVIGTVEENYLSEKCFSEGEPDIDKISPLVLATNLRQYHSLGDFIGKAFSIGKRLTENNE